MTGTLELVAPRALLVPRPRVRLELQPGDRVIAEIGDVVRAGDVLAERIRDARLVEVVLPRHAADQGVPLPGTWLPGEHAQPGRRAGTPAGELLFQHGGRRRLATGPHPDHLSAPADGRLVEVHAGVALVLGGYLRRAFPSAIQAILEAVSGALVGTVGDPPLLLLPADRLLPFPEPDRVVVRGGQAAGSEGRWLGPGGPRRMRGGVVVETGLVILDDGRTVPIAIGDLERFSVGAANQ